MKVIFAGFFRTVFGSNEWVKVNEQKEAEKLLAQEAAKARKQAEKLAAKEAANAKKQGIVP